MNSDRRRIARWLRRAQPPGPELAKAIVAGSVASITNVGLLVGAAGLLVASANRPGLRAVAGVLILIELLAFLRSPLRFSERLSAHRLGFTAVTRWRRWLVATIGRWDYSRWREHASGDLLERSLRDTDELQDLWLRFALPVISTGLTMLLGDLAVALLPPHGRWWAFAATLLVAQLLGSVLLLANVDPLVRADRALRRVRGSYQAVVVELSAAAPELALLGHRAFAASRLASRRGDLEVAEVALHRAQRRSRFVPVAAATAAVAMLQVLHPKGSPTWLVVSALLAVAVAESLNTIRAALSTAVAVSAAAERLEELDESPFTASAPWPVDATLRAEHVTICEGPRILIRDVSFLARPGRRIALTGASGTGKSTLLRALCGLDDVASGTLSIGGVTLRDIDEDVLRARLAYVASEPGLTRGYAGDVVRVGRSPVRDTTSDLASLGIVGDEATKWDELSRGERQRVAIVRSLASEPAIVVLDEPTSGLGADETASVLHLLESTNATILVATHDQQVMRWCDETFEITESGLRATTR